MSLCDQSGGFLWTGMLRTKLIYIVVITLNERTKAKNLAWHFLILMSRSQSFDQSTKQSMS